MQFFISLTRVLYIIRARNIDQYYGNNDDDDGGGGDMNGEAVCEGKDFSQRQCLDVGCCYWEEGECWSAVGRNKCDMSSRKRDLGVAGLRGTHLF